MATYKKILVVVSLLALISVPVFYRPQQTEAFSPGVVAINGAKWTWEKIQGVVKDWKKSIVRTVAVNTTRMFLNSMAYSLADAIANNAAGGKPLFDKLPIGKTIGSAGNAAAGEFLGSLTTELDLNKLGINLCSPNIDLKISLTLGLLDQVDPPKPKCNVSNVLKQWEGLAGRFAEENYRNTLRGMLQVGSRESNKSLAYNNFMDVFTGIFEQSAGAQYQALYDKLKEEELTAEESKKIQIQICKGYLNKETTITKEIKTPCSTLLNMSDEQWNAAVAGDTMKYFAEGEDPMKMKSILAEAGNLFLNTLSSKLMKVYFDKGMLALNKSFENPGVRDNFLKNARGGAYDNQSGNIPNNVFKSLTAMEFKGVENYSFIADFVICPGESDFQSLDNCVIDQKFLAAIVSNKTIREAIDDGLLDPNTVLIGPDDPRNNEKDCYRNGWCHRDLTKLRKANILPAGIELAAMRSSPGSAVTIKEAIDCFEDGGDCAYSVDPQYDFNHNPYYHLVDPDWTLEVPPTRCNAMVNGPALQSSDSNSRQTYCADPQVCLRVDDDGNCIGGEFGYCSRTENIWRFDGDICEDGDLFSGCLTLQNEEFGTNSYLEWTLDYCTAEEAGCRRYAQRYDENEDWLLEEDMTLPPATSPLNEDDLFLSSGACDASSGGCNEYITFKPNTRANILPNGDFEINDDAVATRPDGFYQGLIAPGEGVNGSEAIRGTVDAAAVNQATCWRGAVISNTNYTVSVSAKRGPGDGAARIMVDSCHTESGTEDGRIFSPDSSMAISNDNAALNTAGIYDEANVFLPWADLDPVNYNRFGGTFNTGDSIACTICVGASFGSSDDHYMDNFKVEVTEAPNYSYSGFTPYGAGAKIYMNGRTFMCTEDEVGCQGYNPVNGGTLIPGVITQDDLCPAECVGYATFAEQPDIFDIIEGNQTVDYYHLIPDTADSCAANEVGCEEFTNLDTVLEGGEGKEYYSYLRQCVAEDLGTIFYTWEGYDVSGYALKTWNALISNDDVGLPINTHYPPCTNVDPGTSNCIDGMAGHPHAACGPETANPDDDPGVNSNCREFFDLDGYSYWRLQDRVIFASNDCHDYRRTLTGSNYKAIPNKSTSCSAEFDGCRIYKGNAGNNLRTVFEDQFEGSYSPWDSSLGSLDVSEESVMNGGHSMEFTVVAGVLTDVSRDIADILREDREYTLSWWMKANSNVDFMELRFRDLATTYPIRDFNNLEGGEWRSYKINIPVADIAGIAMAEARIEFIIDAADRVYFDNVNLKEVSENLYLVKDSWETPLSCDDPYVGYHLGCQSYIDLNGKDYDLKSFDKLCRQEAIGCSPVIDTHNSTNPFEETFNIGDYSELTVPEDNLDYLVPDAGKYCAASEKGCQMLGLPEVNRSTDAISDYETVHRLNNPDLYATTLCTSDALYCEEYNSDKGIYFFKDPGSISCTFKRNAIVNIITTGEQIPYTGWFKNDSLAADDPIGCADNGDFTYTPEDFELPYSGLIPRQPTNPSGTYWAAHCPVDKNLCTAYKDPVDPYEMTATTCRVEETDTDVTVGRCVGYPIYNNRALDCAGAISAGLATGWLYGGPCQTYYYYENENIDETSCYGQVDRNSGCVLLYEENNWDPEHTQVTTVYHTTSTYDNNTFFDEPVNPVTCDSGDSGCSSNKLIKVRKSRQCSEWLACKASNSVYNPATDSYDNICDELDTCIEYDSRGGISKCATWDSNTPIAPLTHRVYQTRANGPNDHLQWSDWDFTGYSAPNLLPAGELSVYNFGSNDIPDFKLMYKSTSTICETGIYNADGTPSTDLTACSAFPVDGWNSENGYYQWINTGLCKDEICWITPDYSRQSYVVPAATRGYSVYDSPFPISVKSSTGERTLGYGSANLCYTDGDRCEFGYKKVTYGYGENILYYPTDHPTQIDEDYPIHPGTCSRVMDASGILGPGDQYCYDDPDTTIVDDFEICIGDPVVGSPCERDVNCGPAPGPSFPPDGKCDAVRKIETYINWPGICYEQDWYTPVESDDNNYAHYCNNWYPVQDVAVPSQGLYNNYDTAGYLDPYGNYVQLCAVSTDFTTETDRIYCGATISTSSGLRCSELVVVPAGSKIRAAALEDEGSRALLTERFLHSSTYNVYGAVDPISDGGHNYATGLGLATIIRNEAVRCLNDDTTPCVNTDSLFRSTDFIGVALNSPITTVATLNSLFDGTLQLYFFDEGVNSSGGGIIGGQFIEMPTSSTTTIAGTCWDPGNASNQYQHQIANTATERLCNPLSYNYYVYGGAGYPAQVVPATHCNDRGDEAGCYQSCNRLIELHPTGDDPESKVRTDIWWASREDTYDYSATSTWSFWYGNTASSTVNGVPYSSSLYSLNDPTSLSAPAAWRAELHYSYILTPSSTPAGPVLATTTIGYAFGGSYYPTSLVNVTSQVQIRLPSESVNFNVPLETVPFFGCNGAACRCINNAGWSCWGNNINPLTAPGAETYNDLSVRDRIAHLFRESYSLLWDGSQYVRPAGTTIFWPDYARPAVGNYYSSPRVLAVCASGLCYDASSNVVQGLSVNNEINGSIVGSGGSVFTTTRFFYHAHPDHMPIRNMMMYWGDGASTGNTGKYQNNLPVCNPEMEMPGVPNSLQGFGGTEGACHQGYKVFYKTYLYNPSDLCDGTNITIEGLSYAKPTISNASCYKPNVRLEDNWGEYEYEIFDGWVIVYEN